jgi:hypothetical protein
MHLVLDGKCDNDGWAECLNLKCEDHLTLKRINGFKSYDESFLDMWQTDARDRSEDSFFSTTSRAPGIDVRILMRPLPLSNSLSC